VAVVISVGCVLAISYIIKGIKEDVTRHKEVIEGRGGVDMSPGA
jgi:hypothetical protein